MASFTWDGTTDQTATKGDLGSIDFEFNPALTLANVQDSGGSIVFTSNSGHTFTVTGVTLAQLHYDDILLNGGQDNLIAFGDGSSQTSGDANNNSIYASTSGDAIIGGLGGADYIDASGSGNHFILGGSSVADPADGGDQIHTGVGSDIVYGNGGDDFITDAGGSNNNLYGGAGNNSIDVNHNYSNDDSADFRNSTIFGGNGNDTIGVEDAAGVTNVYGGNGVADSDAGKDNIYVEGVGQINIYGNGGDDQLSGYAESQESSFTTTVMNVFGGQGNDGIDVGGYYDTTINAYGGVGADTINVSTSGTATIYGGTGVADSADLGDTITFGESSYYEANGDYTVFGNGGNDTISGNLSGYYGGGSAVVYGGQGDDSISVNAYSESNFGGPIGLQASFVESGNSAPDITIVGGAGEDTISSSSFGHVTIYGGTGEADAADAADTITFGESYPGQYNGDYTVYGNGGDDTISGNLSSYYGGGSAVVYGGQGDDSIAVNSSSESSQSSTEITIAGGAGADTISSHSNGNVTIYGGTGIADPTNDVDVINFSGSGHFDVYGNGGDDVIKGNLDSYYGSANVFGGQGDDYIQLSTGYSEGSNPSTITGGAGADTINATSHGDLTIFGGSGVASPNDGDDLITFGGEGNFTVYGNGGDDTITGDVTAAYSGAVKVYGGEGDDTITVDSSSSSSTVTTTIDGGNGDDLLTGGQAVDHLTGGAGADTFNFASTDQSTLNYVDTIMDFTHAEDVIDLAAVTHGAAVVSAYDGDNLNSYDSLSEAANHVSETADDASTNSQVITFSYAGQTYVLVDNHSTAGTGVSEGDMLINLNHATGLTQSDFHFADLALV